MNILVVHRYFWPDTPPYASMLRTITTSLAERGNDVSVYTAQPSYGSTQAHDRRHRTETIGNVKVARARLFPESKTNLLARAANLALFAIQVFWHVRRTRPDVVMAATTPPILVAAAATAAAASYGGRSVYHCQDIYPEVAVATGAAKRGLFQQLLRRIDTATMRRADRIVVLSEDMATTVEERDASLRSKVRIVNNFAVEPFGNALEPNDVAVTPVIPEALRRTTNAHRIVFAGNLGNFQGLDSIVETALLTHEQSDNFGSIEWLFLGEGQARTRLEQLAGDALGSTITFAGHWPSDVAEAVVADADLALVSLSPGVVFAAYPSKTLMYLSAGTPLVVVAETNSELATTVMSEQLGIAIEPDQPTELAKVIRQHLETVDLQATRRRCQSFAERETSRPLQLDRWSRVMSDLDSTQHVFLLGAARSGTKFLRDTLASSNDVAAIPYDINYIWRHGNENVDDDALQPSDVNERGRKHIRDSIERLATDSAGSRPIILEKTVSNSLRVDLLREIYPAAKFIYLERDGRDAAESSHRQWTAPNDRRYLLDKVRYFPVREWRYALWFAKNLANRNRQPIWGPRYPGIEEDVVRDPLPAVCARQWQQSVQGWHDRTPHPALELEVRYEDIFAAPETELRRICDFIGISDVHRVLGYFHQEARPVFGSWPGSLSSSEQIAVAAIIDKQASMPPTRKNTA